jgi:hypothetical protein
MAKIERPNASNLVFASKNANDERSLFRDPNNTSNLIDDFITDDLLRGWGLYLPDEIPKIKDFNALGFYSTSLYAYMFQNGIPEWAPMQEYHTNSVVTAGGDIYFSNTDFNVGASPVPTIEQVAWNLEDVSNTTSNFFTRDSDLCVLDDNYFVVASSDLERVHLMERTESGLNTVGSTLIGNNTTSGDIISISPTVKTESLDSASVHQSNDSTVNIVIYDSASSVFISKIDVNGNLIGTALNTGTSNNFTAVTAVNNKDFLIVNDDGQRFLYNSVSESVTLLTSFSANMGSVSQQFIAYNNSGTVAHLGTSNLVSGKSARIYYNTTPFDYSSWSFYDALDADVGTFADTRIITYFDGFFYVSFSDSLIGNSVLKTSDFSNISFETLPFTLSTGGVTYPVIGTDGLNLYAHEYTSTTSGRRDLYIKSSNAGSWSLIAADVPSENKSILNVANNSGVNYALFSSLSATTGVGVSKETRIYTSDGTFFDIVNDAGANVAFNASTIIIGSKIVFGTYLSGGAGSGVFSIDATFSGGTALGPLRVSRLDSRKIAVMTSSSITVYDVNDRNGSFTQAGNPVAISTTFSYDLTSFVDNNAPAGTYKIATYIEGNGDLVEYEFDGNNFVNNGSVTTGLGLSSKTTLSQIDRESETLLIYDDGAVDLIRVDYNGATFDVAFIEDATTTPFSIEELGDGFDGRVVASSYQVFNRGFLLNVFATQTSTVSLPITLGTKEFTNGILINNEYAIAASADDGTVNLFQGEFDLVFNANWRRLESSDISFNPFGTAMTSTTVNDAIKEILYKKYPVGSLYESETDEDPAVELGFGNWQRIVGKMLIAVDPSVPEYDTGGKEGGGFSYSLSETILTVDQIPDHVHNIELEWQDNNKASEGSSLAAQRDINQGDIRGVDTRTTETSGGSLGHTHLVTTKPPFDTAYTWLRLED